MIVDGLCFHTIKEIVNITMKKRAHIHKYKPDAAKRICDEVYKQRPRNEEKVIDAILIAFLNEEKRT